MLISYVYYIFILYISCQKETQFLPESGCIDTAIWMHYMDAN